MWPTSRRYREVLASSDRRWSTRIEVLYDLERVETLDVVVDGHVSIDNVAVRRSCDLIISDVHGDLTPVSARDLLSPKGTELRISRGLRVDGDYEWVPLGVFGLDEPEIQGRELRLLGYDRVDKIRERRFAKPYRIKKGTPTHQAIADIVTSRFPDLPKRVTSSGYVTTEAIFDKLTDPWDAVRQLANADAYEAYFDARGTFVAAPEDLEETDVVYEAGKDSLLIASRRKISAADTYSGVIVTSENPRHEKIYAEAWDLNPKSLTYADGPFGRKPFGYSSPLINSYGQAVAVARKILKRVTRLRQSATLTTIGHVGHDVGDIITVRDPSTKTTGRWVVESARIPLRPGNVTLGLLEYVESEEDNVFTPVPQT